jgi:potassium voltage-gated channel Eag-related subfamily H protein 6/hyperpolarization activated cyclic nucleotide-gated potassium channel 2
MKIRRYLEYVLENKKEQKIDESEVLNLLSKNLKDEVILHLNGQLIKSLFVINKYDKFCILLTNIMREDTYNPNEIIFQSGDYSNALFFITKGVVQICDQETNIVFKDLNVEEFFGEIGFFLKKPRIASAETLTFVNVSIISLELFEESYQMYKNEEKEKFSEFEKELNEYRKKLQSRDLKTLSLSCYLCNDIDHLSPECPRLRNIDELYKMKFKDRKIKTHIDIINIYNTIKEKEIKIDNSEVLAEFISNTNEIEQFEKESQFLKE